jgi:hypothetical protein
MPRATSQPSTPKAARPAAPTTPRARARQPTIRRLRREYLAALEHLGEKSRQVHETLDTSAASLSVVRDHLRAEGDASDFMAVLQPAAMRAALSTALDDFERARHRSQKLLFRLLIAEGMTASEIARAWGISRQLVSRMVNEPT